MKSLTYRLLIISVSVFGMVSCAVSPLNTNIELTKTAPEVTSTIFDDAISQLGLMNEVYAAGRLRVMPKYMMDNTGTSLPTRGEIPRDITEMVKSTLNSFGGGILYVPYDPEFMLNTAKTGYSDYGDKYLPNVVISGGITEFDRALITKGENLDADWSRSIKGENYGIDAMDRDKSSLARITLDFNLIDFKTFTGIPKMQTVNSIKVHKGVSETGLGFTVYGASLGIRGSIKKIQGRHAAVRLLVQASMVQLLGRHQRLPYWRLMPGAKPDKVVLEAITRDFYQLPEVYRIKKVQQYLYLHGYDVVPNGRMDNATSQALSRFASQAQVTGDVDGETYRKLFETVPLDYKSRARQIDLVKGRVAARVAPAAIIQQQRRTPAQAAVAKPFTRPLMPIQPAPAVIPSRIVARRVMQASTSSPEAVNVRPAVAAPAVYVKNSAQSRSSECSAYQDKQMELNCILDRMQ